jgi:hypothetical protein
MNMTEKSDELKILRFRIGTTLQSLFFPISVPDLFEAVRKIGYQITAPSLPTPIARARMTFTGNFAQKDSVILDVNSNRGILGVSADSYSPAIKSFNELSDILQNEFNVDFKEESRFYEIIAEIKIVSVHNPLESMSNMFKKNRFISKVGKILEQDVSMFTLRFIPKGKTPNQEEWLDLVIEPDLLMPYQRYSVSLVFRSQDKLVMEKFGENLESNLLKIISAIRGSS